MGTLTSINGIDVYYELFENNEAKNKPLLLLIHGFLSSSFSFRKLVPLLQQEFSIVAIDLPPFGKSGKCKQFNYSYENLASIPLHLINDLGYKDAILIGHSMGGQICLQAARKNDKVIKKLILLSSSGYLPRLKPTLIYSSYLPFFPLFLKARLKKQGVEKNLLNVVHDQAMIDEEMKLGYEEPFQDNQIFQPLTKMIRDREGDLTSEQLAKIHTPTLLIWGEKDRVVPLKVGQNLNKDLPNSKLIVYKKTGHLIPEEKPDLVKNDIVQFIEHNRDFNRTRQENLS